MRPFSHIDKLLAFDKAGACPLIVVDVADDFDHGIDIIERMRIHPYKSIVVAMYSKGSLDEVRRCFIAGAADVLDKSFADKRIAEALHKVSTLRGRLASPAAIAREKHARFIVLSKREIEVFQALIRGLTSREIGLRLTLSRRTVDIHRASLHKKLDVKNTAQMVHDYGHFVPQLTGTPIADSDSSVIR